MKKLCLFLMLCFSTLYSFCQTSPQQTTSEGVIYQGCSLGVRQKNLEPLWVIDGIIKGVLASDDSRICCINPANIDTIIVLRDSEAIAKYGDDGRGGVVIITLKKNRNKSK